VGEILLDHRAQRQVDGELRRLGTARALEGQRVRRRGAVAAASTIGVATQLPRDRGRRPAQAPGDATDRPPARARERDLLTFAERQAAALQIATTARAHTARGGHPPRALLAVGTDLCGRVRDELAALQRGPKRLNSLGTIRSLNTAIDNTPLVGCCDHRENPRNDLRDRGRRPDSRASRVRSWAGRTAPGGAADGRRPEPLTVPTPAGRSRASRGSSARRRPGSPRLPARHRGRRRSAAPG